MKEGILLQKKQKTKLSVTIFLPLVVALVLFVVLSDKLITGSVVFSENCIDSDDTIYPAVDDIYKDNSYFTPGFAGYLLKNGIRSERLDYCSGNKVVEYYCRYGRIRSVSKVCNLGCSNGVCRKTDENLDKMQACADSDKTKNYDTKGTMYFCSCSYAGMSSCNCITPIQDYCVNSTTLGEGFCEGNIVRWENHTCLYGCREGLCLTESQAKKKLYALPCVSGICKGKDANGVEISYNNLDKSMAVGSVKVSTSSCSYSSCFATITFDSALSGSRGKQELIFAYYANPNYYESISPLVYLAHKKVEKEKGYIRVAEGENARVGDWVVVNPNDYGRILEVSYIAIQDTNTGWVKLIDAITKEALTMELASEDSVYTREAALFDNQILTFNVPKSGEYVNITWSDSGNVEAGKIRLRDGNWIAIGTLSQLAMAYNIELVNLDEGERTWPAVLYIENNANQDMVLVPLAKSGEVIPIKLAIVKPYATSPVTG